MSDPPPKPKIGSLRDRIAAFEKPNAASTPGPAPAPRPKPGNLQWKPRPPSPTQPTAAAAASTTTADEKEKRASGMSASDAKESIGKAGSLKERMAALQGRGGFGAPAPPPIAPKPAVERPKWKPPPAVASPPVDDAAEDTPVPKKSLEIPLKEPSTTDATPSPDQPEAEAAPVPIEGDGEQEAAEVDPEEEERQRRAALAARMARLGGARVGMGPPVFGRVRTPKPAPAAEAAPKDEDESTKIAEPAKSPDVAKSPDSQTESKSDYFPSSAAADPLPVPSANKSTDSLGTDTSPSIPSRSPNSMPVPAAPRRAAPPRRKAAKSPAPPPVEERAAVNDDIAQSPPPVPEVPIEIKADESEPTIDEAQKRMSMDIVTAEVGESRVQPAVEALPTSPQAEEADVTEVPYNRDDSPTPPSPIQDDTPHLPPPKEEITPPTIQQAAEVSTPDVLKEDVTITEEPETEEVQESLTETKHLEPSEVVAEHVDDDDEDEQARKKRIADRVAKMGGVNPFAPPSLQRQTSTDSETAPSVQRRTSSGSVKPPSVKRQMSTSSNVSISEDPTTSHTIPQKRSSVSSVQSFEKRKASMDASLEESRPIPPPRQMTKDDHKPSAISEDAEVSEAVVGEDLDLGRESDDGRDAIEDEEIPSPPPVPIASRPPPVRQTTRPPPPLQASSPPAQLNLDEDTFVPAPPRRRLSLQRVDEPEPEQTPALSPTNEVAESPIAQDQKSPAPAVPHHLVDESPPASPIALHVPPPRRFSSDHEERALPHPMRFTDTVDEEEEEQMSPRSPPRRGVPPPPPVSAVEPDEDDMLPAPPPPPRRTPSDHSSSSSKRHLPPPPPLVSAVEPDEDDMLPAPPPPRRNLPLEPVILPPRRTGLDDVHEPDLKTPVLTVEPDQEILDEDEGDPIDPAFHSPSRRESLANTPSPPRAVPPTHSLSPESAQMSVPPSESEAVDPDQERRRTIAERMAKLGGIKFGAPPVSMGRPPARRQTLESKGEEEEDQEKVQREEGELAVEEEERVELTEEEEERARKERIAAKLAMMGGQRIGMMPPVMGSRPPVPQRRVEEDEPPQQRAVPPRVPPPPVEDDDVPPPPPPPHRAVPPRVPPPPVEDDDVAPPPPPHRAPPPRTAAPQSETDSDDGVKVEAEESEIEEVRHEDAEEVEEEAPPPVPTRAGRRTSSVHRPPVPTSPPPKRSSVQRGDASFTYPPPPQQQQADFVMVEEPGPATSMDFGAGPDLSMSWSEVDNTSAAPPPPPPAKQTKAKNPDDVVMSPEELTAVWGRIGVQVCEAATALLEKSRKALIGDGTYRGFVDAVLAQVPSAARGGGEGEGGYGYTVYVQNGPSVVRRVGEIMPGDVVWLREARLKGHKGLGLGGYSQYVGGSEEGGGGEPVVGVVVEVEPRKSKIRVCQANQHVGQQTVEAVSYRLEDLKSGVVKVFRVLEA